MNLFEYLDRRAQRRVEHPGILRVALPVDFRGWLAFGLFVQSSILFGLIAAFPALQESQGFMTLASAVIVTGWIGGAAAFAYSAGKNSAERTEQLSTALRMAEQGQNGGGGGAQKPDVTLQPGETAQAADRAEGESG